MCAYVNVLLVLWMTPFVFVCSECMSIQFCQPVLQLEGADPRHPSLFVYATEEDTLASAATATCDFMVRLLATSELHVRPVYIRGHHSIGFNAGPPPISGQALSLFSQESRDNIRKVVLRDMALNEDQCLALATMSRLDVELEMSACSLVDGAAGAFIECLQSDRGPIKLDRCDIDTQILMSALTGKNRVTGLKLGSWCRGVNDADMAILFTGIANNRGRVDLGLFSISIDDDNWSILCQSLSAHPTLTKLDLSYTRPTYEYRPGGRCVRMRGIAELMKENTILHTILLSGTRNDSLETNNCMQKWSSRNKFVQAAGTRYQESGYSAP
jgi:hypothetical protein